MCGIAGFLTLDGGAVGQHSSVLVSMTSAIRHRGPDADGHWLDREAGVALGMRRLAVIDVSPAGAQPMTSACGRYVLVFNGEIYNHKALRAVLDGEGRAPNWRGHSDTETLLAVISCWGLVRALQAANGMFAIGLWDRQTRTLSLAVDRFGEKPLYFGWMGKSFLFGSELKSLTIHPAWRGEIDRNALRLLLRYSYIPAPHSIFQGIRKLVPGMIASVSLRDANRADASVNTTLYWSTRDMVERSVQSPLQIDKREAVDQLDCLFRDAVGLRMEADVPLGAFLSGGYDSTAVVMMMQQQSSRPVRTFTIGFTERGYNEAPFAKAVAAHLGTCHTELYISPEQAMKVIPSLPMLYDEPFADSSQVPTFLVSQLARQDVTVALSGDAGDELFGGYNRYAISNFVLPAMARTPASLRRLAANWIRSIGAKRWDTLYQAATLGRGRVLVGDRALKLADLLSAHAPIDGYQLLVSAWSDANCVVRPGEASALWDDATILPNDLNFIEQMMYLDLVTYLPGDILTKVDRATMGVSLEGRMPFLDHRVAEFAWQLPLAHKVRGNQGKCIVRELVHRYVPRALMDRPKTGFGIPIDQWLRGPLRDWAHSLLFCGDQRLGNYLNVGDVSVLWEQHQSGRRNWQARLWPVLMFCAWERAFVDTEIPRHAAVA